MFFRNSRATLAFAFSTLVVSSAWLQGQTALPAPGTPPAATAADEAVKLSPVIATGTRFTGLTVADSPYPIEVIDNVKLQDSGYLDLGNALQATIPAFNFPNPTTPDGNTSVRTLTLHGLSPDQTLILIDGKRYHTSAWVDTGGTIGRGTVSTELGAIPTTAIGRVEVLEQGASAQYGSDAIAGVVNLILRSDPRSGFSGTYGASQKGDGQLIEGSLDGAVPWGKTGYLRLSLYYSDQKPYNRASPDTREQYFGTNAAGQSVLPSSAFGSGTTNPPAGIALSPSESAVNRAGIWQFGGAEEIERSLLVNGETPLGQGNHVQFYTFDNFGYTTSTSPASWRRPGDNNTVRAIYPNGFLPFIDTKSTNYSATFGVRSTDSPWNWDLSQVFGGNELKYYTHNTLNASLGAASPTHFYDGEVDAIEAVTNLDLTHKFTGLLPSSVDFATGAEFRDDVYHIGSGDPASYVGGGVPVLDGPSAGAAATIGSQGFVGISPLDTVRADRSSEAAYVQLENKPTANSAISAAARYEHFSDVGSTFNGDLSGRVGLFDGLSLRGAFGTGFHAPALAQEYFGSTTSSTINNLITIVRTFPTNSPDARALGATDLKPEKSVNWGTGLTYEKGPFSATADYYSIRITDRILLSSNFTGTAVQNFLTADGYPGVQGGRFFTNAADTDTAGLDLSASYHVTLPSLGKLTFTGGFNHNNTAITKVEKTPPQLAALGINQPIFDVTERTLLTLGQPRDKLILSQKWDYRRLSANVSEILYGKYQEVAYTNQTAAQVAAIPAGSNFRVQPTATPGAPASNLDVFQIDEPRWLTNLALSYKLTSHLTVGFGIDNLFDVYPSRAIPSTPAFSGNDNFGTYPYSAYTPFPYFGRFYYGKISVNF